MRADEPARVVWTWTPGPASTTGRHPATTRAAAHRAGSTSQPPQLRPSRSTDQVIFLDERAHTGLDPGKLEGHVGVVRSLVSDGSTVLLTHPVPGGGDAARRRDHRDDRRAGDREGTPARAQARGRRARLTVSPADPGAAEPDMLLDVLRGNRGEPGGRRARPTVRFGSPARRCCPDVVARVGAAGIASMSLAALPSRTRSSSHTSRVPGPATTTGGHGMKKELSLRHAIVLCKSAT